MSSQASATKLKIRSPAQLVVERENGEDFAVHPIWLRERCQDAASMDRITGQRLHDPSDIDLELRLTAVSEPAPGRLHVRFSDGHEAEFLAEDLLAEAALPPGRHDCPDEILWDGGLRDLPRARWQADADDAQLGDWTLRFLQYGFIVFSGVQPKPSEVLKVAATFGFTRETNFGTLFDVRSTPEASDLAYTSVHLDAHTDNPYRSPLPGPSNYATLRRFAS